MDNIKKILSKKHNNFSINDTNISNNNLDNIKYIDDHLFSNIYIKNDGIIYYKQIELTTLNEFKNNAEDIHDDFIYLIYDLQNNYEKYDIIKNIYIDNNYDYEIFLCVGFDKGYDINNNYNHFNDSDNSVKYGSYVDNYCISYKKIISTDDDLESLCLKEKQIPIINDNQKKLIIKIELDPLEENRYISNNNFSNYKKNFIKWKPVKPALFIPNIYNNSYQNIFKQSLIFKFEKKYFMKNNIKLNFYLEFLSLNNEEFKNRCEFSKHFILKNNKIILKSKNQYNEIIITKIKNDKMKFYKYDKNDNKKYKIIEFTYYDSRIIKYEEYNSSDLIFTKIVNNKIEDHFKYFNTNITYYSS